MQYRYKIHWFDYSGSLGPDIVLSLIPEQKIISGAIMDMNIDGKSNLLKFINNVIQGKNEKNQYWTNGYTAEIVEKGNKKMIKVFFRLTDDYEPAYITPEDFKELLEVWIREKAEFEKDPEAYKKKLKKQGGIVEE